LNPLVSVLLCHNRLRHMVQMAIDSYLSQDYANRELVVVDDGPEPISDLVEHIPACRYFVYPARNLSEKRNFGIREARGEFIVHFDADDWSGPRRVSDQLSMLIARPAARVSGYDRAYWYDFVDRRASRYVGGVWSATMIYHRDYALAHPWDESRYFIEDAPFVQQAQRQNVIMSQDGCDNFVATMHNRNSRRTPGDSMRWPFVQVEQLPEGFRRAAGLASTVAETAIA